MALELRMKRFRALTTSGILALASLTGCFGSGEIEFAEGGPHGSPSDRLPTADDLSATPSRAELQGVGGRNITEFWEELEVPLSANAKMLSFDMMKKEVQRAVGVSWVVGGEDQWEKNRATLGGADYTSSFVEDITPSQQKVVLWRSLAWQVCQDAVNNDAGKTARTVFADVDPGAALTPSSAAAKDQVRKLYLRFLLENPSESELSASTSLLADSFNESKDPKTAWRMVCVGLLGSMKFVTY